jgi:hypothetical protein
MGGKPLVSSLCFLGRHDGSSCPTEQKSPEEHPNLLGSTDAASHVVSNFQWSVKSTALRSHRRGLRVPGSDTRCLQAISRTVQRGAFRSESKSLGGIVAILPAPSPARKLGRLKLPKNPQWHTSPAFAPDRVGLLLTVCHRLDPPGGRRDRPRGVRAHPALVASNSDFRGKHSMKADGFHQPWPSLTHPPRPRHRYPPLKTIAETLPKT